MDKTPSEFRKEFGKRLKEIRKENGLSQSKMGDYLSISWRSFQNYETGLRTMPVDAALTFCEKFGIELQWLADGTGPKQQTGGITKTVEHATELLENAMQRRNISLSRSDYGAILGRIAERMHISGDIDSGEIDNYLELVSAAYG
jgi:transcriptional regulator with XRE-family HTH domain